MHQGNELLIALNRFANRVSAACCCAVDATSCITRTPLLENLELTRQGPLAEVLDTSIFEPDVAPELPDSLPLAEEFLNALIASSTVIIDLEDIRTCLKTNGS